MKRGRLKIIIGAVSGSGKTYHMLQEGVQLQQQGRDVVICAVSTLQRPETVRQAEHLERVPSIHWMKAGREYKDLDVEALISRNPEVVLVDGLAHRNRPEALRRTRLEDIKVLLDLGISVITTVNVYELAGVHEVVKQRTGIAVEATVAAGVLELADEVRLIDVSPETMLQRLEEGLLGDNPHPLLSRKGNLGVLRELSLRLVAEGVNESLEKHRDEEGAVGASGASERIVVAAQYHWNGSLHVRRGQQIARRLNAGLAVLAFVRRGKTLSQEQQTFKRSIQKLVQKIDGSFEEVPLPSLRKLPDILVRHAVELRASRIVMGQSRQGRWQQLLHGSLAEGVLRRLNGIDLFLMADRAVKEGERIIPARQRQEEQQDVFRRFSPQELERKTKAICKGSFKVYIGASPGAGKTYTMLREGRALMDKGADVVIGLLETHGRKETAAQAEGLPVIPRQVISYQGVLLEEMDTESIIHRNPEIVLVDELAHTNRPGSSRTKRYEDVLFLLENGISVIATVNVQHLESLNDAVEALTGIRVKETIPDSLLRLADEVELIDVTPQMLHQRMRSGNIYAMDKVEQALGSFFTTGNLIALRELALREIADDVDERLEAWDQSQTLRGPLRKREVIFIGIDIRSAAAERLIRRGFRLAYRLKAEWHVHYVSCGAPMNANLEKKLETLTALTARLGGNFASSLAEGRNAVADRLLTAADQAQTTQLIIGQSQKTAWRSLWRSSLIHRILRRARHMDVLIAAERR
ncbi:histidine kinase [Paenibacillus gorillae]|uniref:histidine kinase n=1 Tax=Paenibacillus gorillae TaxID=1243662 RepID=UPI0005A78364|nr:histidine kinase [Paenibacillus gorillae]